MGIKPWLYDILTTEPELVEMFGGEAITLEGLSSANVKHFPYLIYNLGIDEPEDLAEEDDDISRQEVRIWVHDKRNAVSSSYTRVNQGIKLLKKHLKNRSSKQAGVVLLRYSGTSQELSDDALKTVYRYIDFEAVMGRSSNGSSGS